MQTKIKIKINSTRKGLDTERTPPTGTNNVFTVCGLWS